MKSFLKGILTFEILAIIIGSLYSCNSSVDNTTQTTKSDKKDEFNINIEFLAHASFILKYKESTLLLDPFADTTWISYSFPRDVVADAIFSTHPHYDHDGGIFRNLNPYWQGKIAYLERTRIRWSSVADPLEHS